MKLDQQSDGWHLFNDRGEHVGHFSTLTEASERLDWLENQARLQAESEPSVAPGFWERWRMALTGLFRASKNGATASPPQRVQHWSSSSGR